MDKTQKQAFVQGFNAELAASSAGLTMPAVSAAELPSLYAELAARLNMTEGTVKVAVHRLRQRYRELLRDEIAHTVSSPAEVDDEIRHLFAVLGS